MIPTMRCRLQDDVVAVIASRRSRLGLRVRAKFSLGPRPTLGQIGQRHEMIWSLRLPLVAGGGRMATAEAAIKVRGVSHQFGEEGEQRFVRALADTSLDVARGELLCLIGPSGCGKSTLLNVMGVLMAPSSGGVEVLGKPVAGPLPRDIAFVFQESALFPWNTVLENIELGMTFQDVAKPERAARAALALEAAGLKDFDTHYSSQLSGG